MRRRKGGYRKGYSARSKRPRGRAGRRRTQRKKSYGAARGGIWL